MSNRRTMSVLTAGLAAGAFVLAGCGNGLQTTAAGSDPSVAVPTGTTPASASPSPSTSAPTGTGSSSASSTALSNPTPSADSTPAAEAAGRCTVAQLQVGVKNSAGGAAAGSNYVLLTYRNTGSSSCVLTGFPGVSFVGHGDGTQLGDAAVRNHSSASSPVRVAAGTTTTSLLQIANAGNYDASDCAPTTADGFRVYPPGSRAAVFVRFAVTACQRSTAASPQLTVSPVGTSG